MRFVHPIPRITPLKLLRLPTALLLIGLVASLQGCATTGTQGSTTMSTGVGASDDPRVSTDKGSTGGIVVLYPRIVTEGSGVVSADMAGAIQNHVRELAEKALPGRPIDVRPEPERVCPQGGCDGVSIAILYLRQDDGCGVLALVSPPGQSTGRLVPCVGVFQMKSNTVPFREPPENYITVRDFSTPCSAVLGKLSEHDADVVAAIRAAGGR